MPSLFPKLFLALSLLALLAAQDTLRINCGGPAVIDGANLWQGDAYYSLGYPWYSPSPIPGALPVYNTMRYGNFTYQLPVVAGDYTVRLLFAETSTAITGPGQRQFNVSINGSPVLSSYDLAADAGLNTPVYKSFPATATGSQGLRLQFTTVLRNAVVSGIEVTPRPRPPTQGWCPGPVLSLVGDKTLVVGSSWTASSPCYIHQAINPLATDPLYIATLTSSSVIQLNPTFAGDDDIFLWYTSPRTSTNAVLTIATTQSLGAYYGAAGAVGVYHTAPAKTFAPACTPVGVAYVRAGKFLPLLHTLLGENQVYLDGTVPMSVRYGDGGVTLVLNPATLTAQQLDYRRAALAQATAKSLEDWLQVPDHARLSQLESLYTTLQSTYRQSQIDADSLRRELQRELQSVQYQLNQVRNRPALDIAGGQ